MRTTQKIGVEGLFGKVKQYLYSPRVTKSTLYDTSVTPFCQIIAGSLQHPTIEYILNKNVNTCEYAIMGQNVTDLGT